MWVKDTSWEGKKIISQSIKYTSTISLNKIPLVVQVLAALFKLHLLIKICYVFCDSFHDYTDHL